MTDSNLIHAETLNEAMERVVHMTNNAKAAFGDEQMAEAIVSLWENAGVCGDAMMQCCMEYAQACFDETPELHAIMLLMPESIISGALARGIIIGLILGRENPR